MTVAGKFADTIFRNGRIYTVDRSAPWANCVAVKAGRFIAVGDEASVQAFAGPETAAARQLGRGATMMLPTEDSLWVGDELSRRFGKRYWTLTTSATDANRGAIRISRMITGRTKVLVFSGCYHGGVEKHMSKYATARSACAT